MKNKFLKFLGVASSSDDRPMSETESVRHIIHALEEMPADQAHYLSLFASILSRVAHCDLDFADEERTAIEEILQRQSGLPESQAVLVTEIAVQQNRLLGGVENYLITREFEKVASLDQRVALVQALFAVAAAEGGIATDEEEEIRRIVHEVGLTQKDFLGLRAQFKEQRNVLQGL